MRLRVIITHMYNLLALATAILVTYYVLGGSYAVIAILVGTALELTMLVYESRLNKKVSDARELSNVFSVLHATYVNMRHYGRSFLSSVEMASKGLSNAMCGTVASLFDEIKHRVCLGQDLTQAIVSACAESHSVPSTILMSVASEYEKNYDIASSIKNSYIRLWKEKLRGEEKVYGSLQKYTTICMALGTVLPSFVLFAFVGYSMVYYSTSLLFIFSIIMLFVLPKLYAALRLYMVGMYVL